MVVWLSNKEFKVNMVLNINNYIRGWEEGEDRGMEAGEQGDYIYLSLHCHRQNDSCIKCSALKKNVLIILYVNCFGMTMLYMCVEYHI